MDTGGRYGGMTVNHRDGYRTVCGQSDFCCPLRREIPGTAADWLHGNMRTPFFCGDILETRLQRG